MVAGVVAALWLTDRRYRRAGGQAGVILDVATVAVPVGLVGARLYSVLTNFGLYFGPGRDWTDVFRVWEGGLGIAGAVAAGAIAAWAYCRRSGLEIGPIALAAAPALAVAQAIAVWGNWFSQELYGSPSGLPWAVAISPQHRAAGLQAYATFQPVFLYQSLLDLLVAAGVSYAIYRYALTGDRAFALYGALYAAAGCIAETMRVDYSPRTARSPDEHAGDAGDTRGRLRLHRCRPKAAAAAHGGTAQRRAAGQDAGSATQVKQGHGRHG